MSTSEQSGAGGITLEDVGELLNVANFFEGGTAFIKSAGKVATVGNVAIYIYPHEPTSHRMPHFHARFNDEEEASYAIGTGDLLAGELKNNRHKAVSLWRETRVEQLMQSWAVAQAGGKPLKIAANIAISGHAGSAKGAVGRLAIMELDDFVHRIKSTAASQGIPVSSEIVAACTHLSDAIYEIAKQMCEE